MKLTVIVPVYNENKTVRHLLEVIQSVPVSKEIIIVDDGSTDGTREMLKESPQTPEIRMIYHDKNRGKGSAVRTGIRAALGDVIIIQDADLEYDPMDYLLLLDAMQTNNAHVVYGSRFLKKKPASSFWHRWVNYFLTGLTNILFGSRLTDMETCYKLFRTSCLRAISLGSDGFEIEVEITAKMLKGGEKIIEVPISYKGRSFHEGKKIGWKDGVKAVWALFRYRFFSE